MKSLVVLGSTGSIGTQTLDLVRGARGGLRVEALCAGSDVRTLLEQAREFEPRVVGLSDPQAAEALRAQLSERIAVKSGPRVAAELAAEADYDLAVHGVVGFQGLEASGNVLRRGKRLALANKESLVAAGAHLMRLAERHGGTILPVDSELCAIHQCLAASAGPARSPRERVRRVILTASGGSLRDWPLERMAKASVDEALRHPNWTMGPRITVGSATLMNKALEVLEVQHLFDLTPGQIDVVLHRQSLVHSMVEFVDGSVLAQMGPADMRGPLHYCLHHPERAPNTLRGFDLGLFKELHFDAVDLARFPALGLGRTCLEWGGESGLVLNAADEEAVAAFLARRIDFGSIVPLVEECLQAWRRGELDLASNGQPPPASDAADDWPRRLAAMHALDRRARTFTRQLMTQTTRG